MEFFVQTKSQVTELQPTKPIPTARKALLGDSKPSEELQPLFAEALFKVSRLRLSFERWDEQKVLKFITSAPHRVRHLEFVCEAAATCCPPTKSEL
jgi:hypothetical protein